MPPPFACTYHNHNRAHIHNRTHNHNITTTIMATTCSSYSYMQDHGVGVVVDRSGKYSRIVANT